MYPGLVSCPFYAIPIYPFKFIKFVIYLLYITFTYVQCTAITHQIIGVAAARKSARITLPLSYSSADDGGPTLLDLSLPNSPSEESQKGVLYIHVHNV